MYLENMQRRMKARTRRACWRERILFKVENIASKIQCHFKQFRKKNVSALFPRFIICVIILFYFSNSSKLLLFRFGFVPFRSVPFGVSDCISFIQINVSTHVAISIPISFAVFWYSCTYLPLSVYCLFSTLLEIYVQYAYEMLYLHQIPSKETHEKKR